MAALADQDGRVVVTQDADIRSSHLLTGSPARLLIVDASSVQGSFSWIPPPVRARSLPHQIALKDLRCKGVVARRGS